MIPLGTFVQAVVEKLVFPGRGLIRYEGWVIFVDDVIPGEEVVVEIVGQRKSYLLATLVKVVVSSDKRIKPLCKHFGVCGGCQLQHLRYAEQLHWKALWLQETLDHLSKLQIPPISTAAAQEIFAYRKKITLHMQSVDGQIVVGYISKDNETLFAVDMCPIFIENQDPLFEEIKRFVALLEVYQGLQGHIAVLKHEDKFILRVCFSTELPSNAKAVLQKVATDFPRWHSVIMESPKEQLDTVKGDLSILIDRLTVYFSSKVFLQNHPTQSLALYQDIVAYLDVRAPNKPVLDLYCGIGILSQLLARNGHTVVAVEAMREAVILAKKSAHKNKLGNISFFAMKAEVTEKLYPEAKIVIVNPPRIGLSEQARHALMRRAPAILIYISCMPATLGRDLKTFTDCGYKINQLKVYDMFPQTAHLETVAILSK